MDPVIQAKMLLAQALALLGGTDPTFTADNDPMTAVLDRRGVWRPGWLREANAKVLARYPGLIKPGTGLGFDGKPTAGTPIRLIDGFLYQPIKLRSDITAEVRDLLQKAHNDTFLAATTGDFGNVLAYMPLDPLPESPGPGYFTVAVHSLYTEPELLKAHLLKLYRTHDLLPAE